MDALEFITAHYAQDTLHITVEGSDGELSVEIPLVWDRDEMGKFQDYAPNLTPLQRRAVELYEDYCADQAESAWEDRATRRAEQGYGE